MRSYTISKGGQHIGELVQLDDSSFSGTIGVEVELSADQPIDFPGFLPTDSLPRDDAYALAVLVVALGYDVPAELESAVADTHEGEYPLDQWAVM